LEAPTLTPADRRAPVPRRPHPRSDPKSQQRRHRGHRDHRTPPTHRPRLPQPHQLPPTHAPRRRRPTPPTGTAMSQFPGRWGTPLTFGHVLAARRRGTGAMHLADFRGLASLGRLCPAAWGSWL